MDREAFVKHVPVEELPQSRVLETFCASGTNGAQRLPPIRINADTGQIGMSQHIYQSSSAGQSDLICWNLIGFGKYLDYAPDREGFFVISPTFTLSDGTIYALKFTPFPKKGKLAESTLSVIAIPNLKE